MSSTVSIVPASSFVPLVTQGGQPRWQPCRPAMLSMSHQTIEPAPSVAPDALSPGLVTGTELPVGLLAHMGVFIKSMLSFVLYFV